MNDQAVALPVLLTLNEVAKALKVSRTHAYRLAQTGELPSVRFGRCVRVAEEDLRAFIAGKKTSAESGRE